MVALTCICVSEIRLFLHDFIQRVIKHGATTSQWFNIGLKSSVLLCFFCQKSGKHTSDKAVLISEYITIKPTEHHILQYSIRGTSFTLKQGWRFHFTVGEGI